MTNAVSQRRHSGMEPQLATRELDLALDRQGYVVVRLMNEMEAFELAQAVQAFLPEHVEPNQPKANWYLGLLDADRARAVASARCVWDALTPRLLALLAGGRCHYTSVAVKPRGADETPFHQHWSTTADPFARRIGCWTLLSPSTGRPATFRLVPRSHQILPFIRHHASGDYFTSFSDALDTRFAIDLELAPGEAVLFEDSILHATGANHSDDMRIAAIANVVGQAMPTAAVLPGPQGYFSLFDTQGVDAMGDYLKSGNRPQAWHELGMIPDRNRAISEDEFARLLALDLKASLDFDPLDVIRRPESEDRSKAAPTKVLARLLARIRGH